MFHLTSSLVSSRPVWNCTPWRRLNLTRLKSGLTSQLSASIGWTSPLASYWVRRSYAVQVVSVVAEERWWPSRFGTSPAAAKRSMPPVLGVLLVAGGGVLTATVAAGGAAARVLAAAVTGVPAGVAVGAGGCAAAPQAVMSARLALEVSHCSAPRRLRRCCTIYAVIYNPGASNRNTDGRKRGPGPKAGAASAARVGSLAIPTSSQSTNAALPAAVRDAAAAR